MPFVEVDDVHGVRAAVTTFGSDTSSVRFVLVPVSPLGVPAYYEAFHGYTTTSNQLRVRTATQLTCPPGRL